VVGRQFSFLQNYDIGFDRKDIVHTFQPTNVNWPTYKAELETNPDILQSTALFFPMFTDQNYGPINWVGKSGRDSLLVQTHRVDVNFLDFFSIGMQSGDFFMSEQSNDNYIVINQTAARIMGLDHPIGHIINSSSGNVSKICRAGRPV